jgi:hypothetical protein
MIRPQSTPDSRENDSLSVENKAATPIPNFDSDEAITQRLEKADRTFNRT